MKFTTAFFATTTLSSLVVFALAEIKDDKKFAELLSESRSYDDDHVYKREDKYDMRPYQIFNIQSKALNNISMSIKYLSRDGKLNMDKFDDNKAMWTLKMAEIAQEAEGKLPGPYKLDKSIAFHRTHFKKFVEASDLRARLRRSSTNSFGIEYVDEIMRIYTELYKLYFFNGRVNTNMVDIETIVRKIENDFIALSKRVEDAKALLSTVAEFYGQTSAEVRASLDEVMSKSGILKLYDAALKARDLNL